VEEARFFKPEEALKLATYHGDREILKKALSTLNI